MLVPAPAGSHAASPKAASRIKVGTESRLMVVRRAKPRSGLPWTAMYSTRVLHHIAAPRAAVYRALLDPKAVARWRVPDGMTSEVHLFEAHEGGRFRVSLTYSDPA